MIKANIEYSIKGNTNNLVCIYIDNKKCDGNQIILIGVQC